MNQIGRYQIQEELGRGAMGVVYKALDPAIGRIVAIKTIRLGDFTDVAERQRVRDRLLREAQSAGALSHPNIITIYDILEQEEAAFIFMEYVPGESLEQMVRNRSIPGSDALLLFLRQVAEALDYAHRKGTVHRDIKPANIIISGNGYSHDHITLKHVAKIADFGVAKFVSHEMTHTGTMIGTPNYMSPEQIQGLTVDGRADQYSLAVVVYELLTAVKPFSAENIPALFYAICKQEPAPVDQVNPALTPAVNKVLSQALAKDPAERFTSCSDFIGALAVALSECRAWQAVAKSIEPVRELPEPSAAPVPAAPELPLPVPPPVTPTLHTPTYQLPARTTRRRSFDGLDEQESPGRESFGKKLGLILAMCFAIGAAIVFIVRWNSGPAMPVQVLDTKSAPETAPPENMNAPESSLAKMGRPEPSNASVSRIPVSKTTEAKLASHVAPPLLGDSQSGVELLTDPPGAKIQVDGKTETSCNSPCTLLLADGRHTLTAELTGYAIARRIFTVPNDNSLFVTLNQSLGVIMVSSAPNSCRILVDGREFGRTPATLHLPVGEHRITVLGQAEQHGETVEVQTDGFDARRFPCQ